MLLHTKTSDNAYGAINTHNECSKINNTSKSTSKLTSKNTSKIQTHIFSNGLRLIYEQPYSSLPITSINAFCDIGSANETDDTRGVAHFIEHMCFKGTRKIPHYSDIYTVYDDAGAYLNAMTNKRYTNFIVKTSAEFTHHCIDMLSDMMLNSTFDRNSYEKEHKIVIEEALQSEDDPVSEISDLSEMVLYAGTSYSYPIDIFAYHNAKKNKRVFSYKNVVEMYRLFYRPDNIVLSIVSSLPFPEIKKMVEASFFIHNPPKNALPKKEYSCSLVNKYAIKYDLPNIIDTTIAPTATIHHTSGITYAMKVKPNNETIHVNISFRVCNMFSADRHILDVLRSILSGTFGSILRNILREKNGLTYSSNTYTTYYERSGDFTIYAQVDRHKILYYKSGNKQKPGVLPIIIKLLNSLIKNGVSEQELAVAKRNIRGKMAIGLENSMSQSNYNGQKWLLYSNSEPIVPIDQIYDVYVKPVSITQINDAIKTYFHKETMFISMVGDKLPGLSDLEQVCEMLHL